MQKNRPLSPHLHIYKLPLTSIISIVHRITGVVLALGIVVYVFSFYCILQGNEAFLTLQSFLNSGVMPIVVWFFIYALFFHFCHGIRHLLWDVGKSFTRDDMNRNAMFELAISLALTLIFY